jgi:hypothetical protein
MRQNASIILRNFMDVLEKILSAVEVRGSSSQLKKLVE